MLTIFDKSLRSFCSNWLLWMNLKFRELFSVQQFIHSYAWSCLYVKPLNYTINTFLEKYIGTLECDYPDNLTTLLIWQLFVQSVWVFFRPNYEYGHSVPVNPLDEQTTLRNWPVFARLKSGLIIKVPLFIMTFSLTAYCDGFITFSGP